ncbi:MAG: NAD+ synthase [Armatimonadetes bacterium]|nr:NAD+ synthase [Armatimonadota bacterium]
MRTLRFALAQMNPTVGDLEGNTRRIVELMDAARAGGADIVAFPELAATGYPPEDLLLKPDFVEANLEAIQEIARRARDVVAVVGFVDRDGPVYNAAAICAGGRVAGVYRKRILPNYGVFDEKRYFAAGDRATVFTLGDVPFGVTICEDIWFPDGPAPVQTRAGALVIVNINGSPFHRGKAKEREEMLRRRACDMSAIVVYANMVGGQDELVFDGGSLIFDQDGQLLARGPQFEETLLFCDVDVEAARRVRARRTGVDESERFAFDRSGFTPTIALDGPRPPRRPAIPPASFEPLSDVEEVYRAIVVGTRDYVRKNGFQKVVIGLSGGVDSALVAAIAVDAVGADNVAGVSMPSPYTSKVSIDYAGALASHLGIDLTTIPIAAPFQSYLELLAPVFAGRERDVTEENLQARIRGNLLMALSNKYGWLVLTTGNKSEMSTGYATLYGDMAGGFAALKDVPKTLVYALAAHRNAMSPVIPQGVLTRVPTAELRPNQIDQDSLPPYPVLDAILERYVERDMPPDDIVRDGFDAAAVARVVKMTDRAEYKRRQAPPGVKITAKAFGRDRRLPITSWYRGWARLENRTWEPT